MPKAENGIGGNAEAGALIRRNRLCSPESHSTAEQAGGEEAAPPYQRGEGERPAPPRGSARAKPRGLLKL